MCKRCAQEDGKRRYRSKTVDDPMVFAWRTARQRAKAKGLPFNIEVSDLVVPEKCPVLGVRLAHARGGRPGPRPNSPSVDRIVPELGYTKGNVVIISQRANAIKQDATPQELEAVASWLRRMLKPLH